MTCHTRIYLSWDQDHQQHLRNPANPWTLNDASESNTIEIRYCHEVEIAVDMWCLNTGGGILYVCEL